MSETLKNDVFKSHLNGFFEKCAEYGMDQDGMVKMAIKSLIRSGIKDVAEEGMERYVREAAQEHARVSARRAATRASRGAMPQISMKYPKAGELPGMPKVRMSAPDVPTGAAKRILPSAAPGAPQPRQLVDALTGNPATARAEAEAAQRILAAQTRNATKATADAAEAAATEGGTGWLRRQWDNPYVRYPGLVMGGTMLGKGLFGGGIDPDDLPPQIRMQLQSQKYQQPYFNPYTSGYYNYGTGYNPYTYIAR